MSKRILSFLLVLTMVLGLFPATVLATQTGDTSVTVTFTASHGEKFYTPEESGKVMIQQQLTIPYFDLALYGLEEYYYNPDCYSAGGNPELQKPGTAETAEGIVTVMHLFIYATEIFKCELSPRRRARATCMRKA